MVAEPFVAASLPPVQAVREKARSPTVGTSSPPHGAALTPLIGTAAAGSQQRYRLFIENCHVHVVCVSRAIAGATPRHINPLAFRPPRPKLET